MTPESSALTTAQEALLADRSLLARIVPRFARRGRVLQEGDLTSLAYLSLRKAAQNFDPSLGVPFEGYAYRFVHLDLKRATLREDLRNRTEHAGSFDAAYEFLERARDPGDLFSDGPAEARAHLADFANGLLLVITARMLGSGSTAPTEDELAEHVDLQARRQALWSAVEALGDTGRVLILKYRDNLEWDEVAQELGVSSATARRRHDEVIRLLGARLGG